MDVRKYWHLVQQSDSRFFGSDPVPPDDLASARQPYPCHQSLLSELHRFSRQSSSGDPARKRLPAFGRLPVLRARHVPYQKNQRYAQSGGCPKDVLLLHRFCGQLPDAGHLRQDRIPFLSEKRPVHPLRSDVRPLP